MGARPGSNTSSQPTAPITPTAFPDALVAATSALTPWLTMDKTHPLPRELRNLSATVTRLQSAHAISVTSETPLFDRVASADATTALLELRDIATRARAATAARPRIKLDWRARERSYALSPARHNSSSSSAVGVPIASAARLVQTAAVVSSPGGHGAGIAIPASNAAVTGSGPPDIPVDDRKRVEAVANRLDALLQVALWKRRDIFASVESRVQRTTSCVPMASPGRFAVTHKKGPVRLRHRIGRRGRVFSNGDVALPDGRSADIRFSSSQQHGTQQGRPSPSWFFSLIESPITPLRSRTLDTVDDGQTVMAVWRGARVSVKVIRHDERRFTREADYLHALGLCPNIPALLGAHWEHAPTSKKKHSRAGNTNVGYLVMQVANGVSLDKLVRDSKLSDTVTKIRLLERVVAALVFAQKVNPVITHQDLHPGNILLVPSNDQYQAESSPASTMASGGDVAPLFTSASNSSTLAKATLLRTATNSTVVSTTDVSFPKPNSSSSLAESSAVMESAFTEQGSDQVSHPIPPPPSEEGICPTIPKVEDVPQALTVLERVALHNSLDEIAQKEKEREQNAIRAVHSRPLHLPSVESAQPVSSQPPRRPVVQPIRVHHADSVRSQVQAASQTQAQPPSPPTPSSAARTTSASTMETTASVAMRSSSRTSSYMDEERVQQAGQMATAFTVKVMDFAPADEAEGRRLDVSWEINDALAGYCAPEKVTSTMRYRMQMRREKERERRAMLTRTWSGNGRGSPPVSKVRSAMDHRDGSYDMHGSRTTRSFTTVGADSAEGGTDGGMTVTRSSSSSHRRAHDSETYALFGDDGFDDAGIVSTEGESMDCDEGEDDWRRDAEANVRRRSTVIGGSSSGGGEGRIWSSERHVQELVVDAAHLAKVDVWSVGWLLYYMCTSRHPPRDAWARRSGLTTTELKEVPEECRDIVKMCVEPNVSKRACLRDVKRRIDSQLQTLMFHKGVSLLHTDRDAAAMLLDKAVGIQTCGIASGRFGGDGKGRGEWGFSHAHCGRSSDGEEGIGLNERTRTALSALPLIVVRRVEWEAAGRFFNVGDEHMAELRRAQVKGKWNKTDVRDGATAIRYLESHVAEGVTSAQSALGWIYRWGAGGVRKDIRKAVALWTDAVERGWDAEGGNGLGLLFHHGRGDISVDGEKARFYYELAVDEGYPAAAVNLGVLLHDGAGKVGADGVSARQYYEMACREGDAIAANNLGLLLHHGGVGVSPDAASARAAYEVAILRNERHHACRNLGELLWDGADGVVRDRHLALDYFAMAINRGDGSSRAVAIARLKRLVGAAQHEVDDVRGVSSDGGNDNGHGAHHNHNHRREILQRGKQMLIEVEALNR